MAAILAVAALLLLKVDLDITGGFQGIFLLKGEGGAWLEITDDLFPEDVDRYLWGHPLTGLRRVFAKSLTSDWGASSDCQWDAKTGRGFIKTRYADGRKLLICLSRFKDDRGVGSRGLFLGGAWPPTDPDANVFDRNESGMAYYDGNRYYHIWCNVNEGIVDDSSKLLAPESWDYLGSGILEESSTDLTLVSRHRTLVNKIPVEVERYLFYGVGDDYLTLATKITNVGASATSFTYFYGDEPWVGNYGTSAGDVGWLKDRLLETETLIDTKKQSYAGIFDYGNPLAGEKQVYTRQANFIEWQQTNGPSVALISNDFEKVGKPEEKIALSSHLNRVIALEWGKLTLQPGSSFTFKIAVGMATYDPRLKLPVKPYTGLN